MFTDAFIFLGVDTSLEEAAVIAAQELETSSSREPSAALEPPQMQSDDGKSIILMISKGC